VVPAPGVLSTVIEPAKPLALGAQDAHPEPATGVAVGAGAGGEPVVEERGLEVGGGLRRSPAAIACSRTPSQSMPPPSSAISTRTRSPA